MKFAGIKLARGDARIREAAVALASLAVSGEPGLGHPIHEWVTEGRRRQYESAKSAGAEWALAMRAGYSSCGDLAHWLLFLLGVRHPFVNRSEYLGWQVSANISRLAGCPWYVHARPRRPSVGDILHFARPDHVCVLLRMAGAGADIETADYGQPYAKMRTRSIDDGRFIGFVSMDLVAPTATTTVPDGFAGADLAPGVRIPKTVEEMQ